MKITLIYTGIFEGNNIVPPLGILYLAAVLERAGHTLQVLDIDPWIEPYLNQVVHFGPQLIGIGFLTSAYPRAKQCIADLKQKLPGALYCCGGAHATADPAGVLRDFKVDFVAVGEGEMTMLEACQRINAGAELDNVAGVVYNKDGRFVDNGAREYIADLDTLPLPARHLVDYERRYCSFPGVIRGRWVRSTILMIGRGCPFNCIYCGVKTVFGRTCRLRSVGSVISELRSLVSSYKIRGVFFNDSTFTANKKWVIDFCERLRAENLNLTWGCNARVDTLSAPMLYAMKNAGCVRVDFGVESGSDRVLKILNKGVTREQVLQGFALARKAGLKCGASFMVGNPYEPSGDLEQTLDLAKKLRSDYTVFFYTTPFPGTPLYDMAQREKWIDKNPDFSSAWAFRESDLPAMSGGMPPAELVRVRARFQNAFFIKNYLHWYNARIILVMAWQALSAPFLTLRVFREVIKLRRFDSLAERFLTHYRLKRLHSK
ncbi:MAG: radical SAM protein [Chitinivibrionales bacterium]|nr:radical SAM protein [Chitinivibrionales bacterium]